MIQLRSNGQPLRIGSGQAWGLSPHEYRGCKLEVMKKQASDQSFHDRRYQERKRAEAAKKVAPKKVVREAVREGSPAK